MSWPRDTNTSPVAISCSAGRIWKASRRDGVRDANPGVRQIAEVEPGYFETSYYAAPDRAGERAYALLLQALRPSGLVGIAQVAMHQREHVVVIRPGRRVSCCTRCSMSRRSGARTSTEPIRQIWEKELNLALLLVNSLTAPFEASKYRNGYREKLDALIAAKLENKTAEEIRAPVHL